MAEQKEILPSRFEPLADLGRKYASQRKALRKRVLDNWKMDHGDRLPTTRELRNTCILLIENPQDFPEPYGLHLYLIVKRWLKIIPPPKRPLGARDVAELVDFRVRAGMSLTEARRDIATTLGMEFAAVERAHQREGTKKRAKLR